MPQKTTTRLRALLEELQRAQHESGGMADQAREELAGAISGDELRPAASTYRPRRKKAGKKKR